MQLNLKDKNIKFVECLIQNGFPNVCREKMIFLYDHSTAEGKTGEFG